jgi:hypothetical protein
MEILTLRDKTRGDATAGYVMVDNNPFCKSLEDEVREPVEGRPAEWNADALAKWVRTWKVPGKTAMTSGRYHVAIDMSTRFKKLMIHLLDVPGFDGIRAHSGLRPEDTEGCLLLADELAETAEGPRIVSGTTRPAVERMMELIQTALDRGEEVWWEVRNHA